MAAPGAPNFKEAKVRGGAPGRARLPGEVGPEEPGAGVEGTERVAALGGSGLGLVYATVTGTGSPVARSSAELGFGCSGPGIGVPLTPHPPSQMRGEWRKCCSSARVAWRKNRGEGKKAKKARERGRRSRCRRRLER